MIFGSHMMAGSLVALGSRRIWLVVPLSLGLHFVLDSFCHDPFIEFLTANSPLWVDALLSVFDLGLGLAFVLYAVRAFPASRVAILAAVAASVAPDVLLHTHFWAPFQDHSAVARAVIFLHYGFHNGFGPQSVWGAALNQTLAILIPAVVVIYCGRRQAKRRSEGLEERRDGQTAGSGQTEALRSTWRPSSEGS